MRRTLLLTLLGLVSLCAHAQTEVNDPESTLQWFLNGIEGRASEWLIKWNVRDEREEMEKISAEIGTKLTVDELDMAEMTDGIDGTSLYDMEKAVLSWNKTNMQLATFELMTDVETGGQVRVLVEEIRKTVISINKFLKEDLVRRMRGVLVPRITEIYNEAKVAIDEGNLMHKEERISMLNHCIAKVRSLRRAIDVCTLQGKNIRKKSEIDALLPAEEKRRLAVCQSQATIIKNQINQLFR